MSDQLREIGKRLASGIIPRGAAKDVAIAADEIDRLRAETEEASGLIECLGMVRDTLAVFLGEEDMKGTAPMFYPEAIRSAMFRAQRGDYKQESPSLNDTVNVHEGDK